MDYVRTLTFKDLIKYQLKGVESLDIATIRRLKPLLENAEAQLRYELDKFSTEQYSYQKRMQTIVALNKSIDRMEAILIGDFEQTADMYYDFGQMVSYQEIKEYNALSGIETPSINKTKLAIQQNKFIVNNAEASLKEYTAKVRTTYSNAITQGILMGRTGYEITTSLNKFVDKKKWRLHRIVRTESHKIYNESKLLAYGEFKKQHFPDLMKRLYHPMDHRTAKDSKQLAKIDPAVPIDKPFVFTYKRRLKNGQMRETKRVFMTPPDRTNDRASLIPYRKSWSE